MATNRGVGVIVATWIQRSQQTAVAWWIVGFVFLYGVLSAVQLLLWLSALLSLSLWIMTRGRWGRIHGAKTYFLLIGCWLVPGLLSAIGAIDVERALSINARFIAYGLAGLAFIRFAPRPEQWPNTVLWLVALLMAWSIDGIVQEWRGISLSGYPLFTGLPEGHKVTGSMGLDYGPQLAVLSPFLFEALRLHGRRLPWLWLALPILATAISLSASRYSALLLLASAIVSASLWIKRRGTRDSSLAALIVVLALGGLVLPVAIAPHVGERFALIAGGMGGDAQAINVALAFRPELWSAAWDVFCGEWLAGVGLRGSAQAMLPALSASSIFPEVMLQRPWHPHLGVLEIAADTGIVGVIGYGLFLLILLRLVLRCEDESQSSASVFFTIAALALFPLSSALSMYSFPTGSLAWPAIALGLGVYFAPKAAAASARSGSP